MINMEKLTQKAQEALAAAKSLADENGHAEIKNELLFSALLGQEDGVVPALLQNLGLRAFHLHLIRHG